MGKVYAYLRVSTDSQNLMQQQNAINEYIKYKGLTITDVVTDEGVSGGVSYKDRHLYNLIQSLNEGDVIVVSEISRLGRSMSDLNKLVNEELKPRKIRLIIITMGLDLDCSNLKAIDEMILFAFSFSAQVEKEMIQERTRNALEARKKKIVNEGGFYSKKGKWCTKLGNDGKHTQAASIASAKKRQAVARENASNLAVYKYIRSWEKRNIALNKETPRKVYEELSDILNELGYTTPTGLEFNQLRLRAMWDKLQNLYKDIN